MNPPTPPANPVPLGSWLAGRDPRDHARAAAYLDGLGPGANEALHAALTRVEEQRSLLDFLPTVLLPVGFLAAHMVASLVAVSGVATAVRYAVEMTLMMAFFFLVCIGRCVSHARLGPRRRALVTALAEREDQRVIGPLLERVWLRPGVVDTPDARRDIALLTRLLTLYVADPDASAYPGAFDKPLRECLDALYPRRPARPRHRAVADLTDAQADLLATMVRVLGRWNDAPSRVLLSRIADTPADAPNRAFVRDAARAFLPPSAAETTPAPAAMAADYTPTTADDAQSLRGGRR